MKKIIVYCHGFSSDVNSDKVNRLRTVKNSTVVAFPIDVDPSISLPELTRQVDSLLLDDMHQEALLIFVGTSLGAWYASKLGSIYGAPAILINPCYDPKNSLKKYGTSEAILEKYSPIDIGGDKKVFIAQDDEVINYFDFDYPRDKITYSPIGGHRFNGPEFDLYVVKYLNEMPA